MNSESVKQFTVALVRGDDADAVSLLENGRVTFHSLAFDEVDGIRQSRPLIFFAVVLLREQVVRALVRLGASIDTLRVAANGDSITPAGNMIFENNVPALSLCIRLGADISSVYRTTDSPPRFCSALEIALREAQHDPLMYLLDKMYPARPIRLNEEELSCFLAMASRGSPAKVCYELLESRGYKVKDLEEVKLFGEENQLGSMADAVLSFAQKSGAADLIRYLVKELGLVSSAGRMETLNNEMDKGYAKVLGNGVSPPRADLTKYICAACESVGATKVCGGCMASRYCSTKCQTEHWKTGGHKQECENSRYRSAGSSTS